jgi:hypothetical protein
METGLNLIKSMKINVKNEQQCKMTIIFAITSSQRAGEGPVG